MNPNRLRTTMVIDLITTICFVLCLLSLVQAGLNVLTIVTFIFGSLGVLADAKLEGLVNDKQ